MQRAECSSGAHRTSIAPRPQRWKVLGVLRAAATAEVLIAYPIELAAELPRSVLDSLSAGLLPAPPDPEVSRATGCGSHSFIVWNSPEGVKVNILASTVAGNQLSDYRLPLRKHFATASTSVKNKIYHFSFKIVVSFIDSLLGFGRRRDCFCCTRGFARGVVQLLGVLAPGEDLLPVSTVHSGHLVLRGNVGRQGRDRNDRTTQKRWLFILSSTRR